MAAIPFPSPPLAAGGFVLRPFAAQDFASAAAAREHLETRRWVNRLAQPDGESMVRFVEASRGVAEKAGYTCEGTVRSLKLIRGSRVDTVVYSRLRAELAS